MKPATLRAALRVFAVGVLMAGAQVAQAASINLTPPSTTPDPDLTLFGGALAYNYVAVCKKSSSSSSLGVCGSTYKGPQQWNLSYGKMTVTGTNMVLKPKANVGTGGDLGNGLYSVNSTSTSDPKSSKLTVIFGFNTGGTAVSGILASDPWSGDTLYSSNVTARGKTTAPGYGGPVIVSGTPTNATLPPFNKAYNFGYAGTGKAGIFEFVFNNVGGNYGVAGLAGGIIVSTNGNSLIHPLLGTGTWDSKGVNFWKNNFSASNVIVDTFVPVPAALWLFGSALAGLTVVRRRKTVVSASGVS